MCVEQNQPFNQRVEALAALPLNEIKQRRGEVEANVATLFDSGKGLFKNVDREIKSWNVHINALEVAFAREAKTWRQRLEKAEKEVGELQSIGGALELPKEDAKLEEKAPPTPLECPKSPKKEAPKPLPVVEATPDDEDEPIRKQSRGKGKERAGKGKETKKEATLEIPVAVKKEQEELKDTLLKKADLAVSSEQLELIKKLILKEQKAKETKKRKLPDDTEDEEASSTDSAKAKKLLG